MTLSISFTLNRAYAEVRSHAKPLLKALIVPAIAGVTLDFSGNFLPSQMPTGISEFWSMTCSLLGIGVYALFAVSCHRIILIGPSALANSWGLYWSDRELRFVGRFIAIALLCFVAAIPGLFCLKMLGKLEPSPLSNTLYMLAAMTTYLMGSYVFSRLSMVLPAIAIDHRPTLSQGWNWSRGSGMRLTVALLVPGLIFLVMRSVLSLLTPTPSLLVIYAAIELLFYLLGAYTVAVLSVAFRQLISEQTLPTHQQAAARMQELRDKEADTTT